MQTLASVHHCCCPRGLLDGGPLECQSGSFLEDAVLLLSAHREKFDKRQSQLTLLVGTLSLSVRQVTEHSAPLPQLEDVGPSAVLPLQFQMIVVVHADRGRSGRLRYCF
jgi:hypothetical protein